jgi:predicted RNA-binding protein with PIN domain
MILVIDAFNVMYKFPDLEDKMYRSQLEDARREFLNTLLKFKKRWSIKLEIYVFIDGKKKPGDDTDQETISGMDIIYSKDYSADFMIRKFVKETKTPGEVRVISSDKEVVYFAKKSKCHVQSSEEFAVWISRTISDKGSELTDNENDAENSPPISKDDVAYWQQMFSRERQENKKKR